MERQRDAAEVAAADLDRIGDVLSEIDAPDVELVSPPSDLWDDIVATITANDARPRTAPKVPPGQLSTGGTVVEYWIDRDDVLVDVGRDWPDFARDNGASGLATFNSGQVLWSYFDQDEVRELWQLLVSRVRTSGEQVRVPLRCDAPDARRWFEMTVTPETDSRVGFRCALVFEEHRQRVALLDDGVERAADAEPITVCSWCGCGRSGSAWLDIEDLAHVDRLLERSSLPPISYGICDPCRNDMSADLLVDRISRQARPRRH